jgi:hypothetical protein
MFANYISERLIFRKTKRLMKWKIGLNRRSSKEGTQMVDMSMRKCSISLIRMEMLIKTTVTCHLTSIRIAVIKKTQSITSPRKDVEKKEPLHAVDSHVNGVAIMENSMEFPQKN